MTAMKCFAMAATAATSHKTIPSLPIWANNAEASSDFLLATALVVVPGVALGLILRLLARLWGRQ